MKNSSQSISILGIGTAVPPFQLEQGDAAQRLAEALGGNTESARWAKRLFRSCGVETRYTCEPNLLEPTDRCRYVPGTPVHQIPSTAERMEIYQKQSVPLALGAARHALEDSGIAATEITHLVTVSCTGQFLPGLDTILIQQLGLTSYVQRLPLTFLGCAAGMTAIRLSKQIAEGNRSYKVLIVCVELCTLHIQPSTQREALFATGFFGDGASSCVVGSPTENGREIFSLGESRAVIFPDSTKDMVWTVGNYGFDLYLSPQIPELLARYAPAEMQKLIGDAPSPALWAIHPGGRGIIDSLQKLFSLTDEQTRASRTVLRKFGNVSSATILFVLEQIRRDLEERQEHSLEGISVAFGPGLNAEMMKITYVRSFYGYR